VSRTADSHLCVMCQRTKRGRFTRRKDVTPGTWSHGDSQRRNIPMWYCFTCLPQGEGRDEGPVPKQVEKVKPGSTSQGNGAVVVNIEKDHQAGLALVNPLVQQLDSLEVVDEGSYLLADQLLGKIRNARKTWGLIWDRIQEKVVKPQREALDGVYAINREVDGPLERGERLLKAAMTDYKNEERERIARETAERERKALQLQQEIEAAEQAKARVSSPAARGAITRNINRLESQQQSVMEATPLPVLGTASSTRTVTVIELESLPAFAVALTVGSLKDYPIRQLVINAVNSVLKSEGRTTELKEGMSKWPGCKLVEHTQIVGR
jgi:hypothetical protein